MKRIAADTAAEPLAALEEIGAARAVARDEHRPHRQ
jgi:hypothetical protein